MAQSKSTTRNETVAVPVDVTVEEGDLGAKGPTGPVGPFPPRSPSSTVTSTGTATVSLRVVLLDCAMAETGLSDRGHVAGGVWMATRGPGPVPAAAPEPGLTPTQPASDGSGPKPTTSTMPQASGSKRTAPCETYHHNDRRRPTDHSPTTRDDHRPHQNFAKDQRSPLRRSMRSVIQRLHVTRSAAFNRMQHKRSYVVAPGR